MTTGRCGARQSAPRRRARSSSDRRPVREPGVGAAVGGKKGALIGAVLGGGGATLWDQVTRRRN